MNQEQFSARKLENPLTHQLGDEVVIYDSEQARCHVLNPAAAAVWERCNNSTATVDELTAALATRTGLPADPDLAYLALEELKNANLLDGDPAIPAKKGGINRRKLLMGLGLAAVLLPAVSSVVAPTKAMAASGANPYCMEPSEPQCPST